MENKLEHLKRRSSVKLTASVVIQLIDSFTGKSPKDPSLTLVVEGIKKQPIKKANGFYVFTNMEQGDYVINIRSTNYIEETKVLTIYEESDHDDIVLILLKPSTSYSNQNGQTCIRLAVRDDPKLNLDDIVVTATIKDPKCTVAKLAQEYKGHSSKVVNIVKSNSIAAGDYLWLTQKTKNVSEHCYIAELCDDEQKIRLNKELENDYKRGSLFLPAVQTKMNKNREAIILFRNYQLQTFDVTLEVRCNEFVLEQQLTIEEGKMTNLGVIML